MRIAILTGVFLFAFAGCAAVDPRSAEPNSAVPTYPTTATPSPAPVGPAVHASDVSVPRSSDAAADYERKQQISGASDVSKPRMRDPNAQPDPEDGSVKITQGKALMARVVSSQPLDGDMRLYRIAVEGSEILVRHKGATTLRNGSSTFVTLTSTGVMLIPIFGS